MLVVSWLITTSSARSQIVPDNTLPVNSSVEPGCNICTIEGGTIRGTNLFHSFREFSVPTNGVAFFNNSSQVENIISRVTGSSVSNIDGIIQTNGTANLFLLNPNGIIFGSHAQLKIGGSFLASTANSLVFNDGTRFSATNPQTSPLLTISVPKGLQFGATPGAIQNQSQATTLRFVPGVPFPFPAQVGLQVNFGKTLVLLGGDLSIERGQLTAVGGRIELGSVAGSSFVSLIPVPEGWSLGYEKATNFQNIRLSEANVNASGSEGSISGDINVQGRLVELEKDSRISLLNDGTLDGGSIDIEAERLLLRDGSQIEVGTFGSGRAGNLTVNANAVEFSGTFPNSRNPSGLFAQARDGSGQAGNITINTKYLTVRDGAQVAVSTFSKGQGGNLFINAREKVEVIGSAEDGSVISSLLAQSEGGNATGNAGNLEINTRQLIVRDGAKISVGAIENTSNPSRIGISQGQGGELNINASDLVEVTGTGRDNKGEEVPSTLLAESQGTGKAGDLTIATNRLIIRDGAAVSVSSPEAQAGDLNITANTVALNRGRLTAETGLSRGNREGANINLQGLNLLRLENESQISAEAFGNANGGNINIDTKYLIALPSKGFNGSDIIANAFRGNGGNINITAQRIFGIESRLRPTQFNDITASSEFGTDGVIEINTPEFDPTREELPANLVDVSRLIEQNLCQAGQGSQFTVTGRGGLPNSPNEALSSNETWEDWRVAASDQQPVSSQPTVSRQESIVEAQGWVVNSQGKVVLTAEPIATVPRAPLLTQGGCK
ncbi:filamentous hemagglutinin N-terminal domain-containing protein [Candidatus Gracilibacteria bacterium]|nr:filamentous hemagglutinin N-terminal domain-containing protein [Candidatus Gracilibacteria bacterium]NJM86746.1 filamentous hemagglutinin N-terminal domain-containing protein [Hydrococcus sp. RU_2_2]NJP18350.1 filamentous hemagglutinin N-terminal domain-containing protein [Hydrococcus sp. CRU_1_1]